MSLDDAAVLLFIGWVLTVFVLWIRRAYFTAQARIQYLQQHMIPIRVEVDNNTIYCYNANTHQFLCQGATVQETQAVFQALYPNYYGIVGTGDAATVKQWIDYLDSQNGS
jgi:hypothetical protein